MCEHTEIQSYQIADSTGESLHLSVGQVLAWCRGDFEEGVMVAQPAQLVLEVNGHRLAWGRLERFGAQAVLVIDGVEEHALC